ncbi:MAG TPA: ribosome maturation factor RimM [Acidobacteriaceae bacterium]|jgi:16S rRNA processing protein RimM|nr:ribosome maturation factor RimM [Acidobacteriaceae bacterium]
MEEVLVPDEPVTSRTARGPERLLVARLVRPHGRHGELIAEILTDFPARFHQRSRLTLVPPERVGSRPRDMELENFWFLRSRIVLKFRGIDSINEAEGLRGYEVTIPASERAPLEAGMVYVSDLVGCRLIDLNVGPDAIGEVVDVDRGSSNTDLLAVRRPGARSGEELLIPFVKEYLVSVEPAKQEILMRLPEGLLEINAPLNEEEKEQSRRPSRDARELSKNRQKSS